ncbi:hypothetical protein [Neomegalonema sp.]|uniref:hypothetical protein n=1 Tax=Neomegalonema sp. TaxID=2039713 RepID=UPI002613F076|nr:hypothetical protein [Neomegalonema sp.]MDD2867710.1 hypothetical protein [Neomegalonema sp.]
MAIIYIGEASRLKSFSSTTKGEKGVVRIEIETADARDLYHLLRDLAEIEEQRKEVEAQKRAEARRTKGRAKIAAAPPLLGLPAPDEGGW